MPIDNLATPQGKSKRNKIDKSTNRASVITPILIQPMSKEMVTRNSDSLPNYPETRGKYWKAPRNQRDNKNRELKRHDN